MSMTKSAAHSEPGDTAHRDMANAIRALSMDAVEVANSGHPGMPLGAADVATVLYTQFLKHDPAHPDWPDRDRFVLSAGHGSMLLYSLLYLCGYPDIDIDQIQERGWPGGLKGSLKFPCWPLSGNNHGVQ